MTTTSSTMNDSAASTSTSSRKALKLEPSIVSSSSNSSNSLDPGPPPQVKNEAEVAKMTPAERRRYERNLREQQRSYRISQQIKELRDVLAESNIPFKPNKFSILVNVADYIKQLQARAIMLDAEHRKLMSTISQANQLVATGQVPSSSCEDSEKDASSSSLSGQGDTGSANEQDFLLVRGINYRDVFEHCPFAVGVASLDGRVLGVNAALERLFGCSANEMDQQSLFLFIRNHQDLFEAMADLLKRSSMASEASDGTAKSAPLLFWCGRIVSHRSRDVSTSLFCCCVLFLWPVFCSLWAQFFPLHFLVLSQLRFSITLTSTADASPKYFSFAASGTPAAASSA